MKSNFLIFLLLLSFNWLSAQNLKPYILAFETGESISEIQAKIESALKNNGIQVVGKYQPASDKNRSLIILSSPELQNAVKKVGGLTGFAATLRIGITLENGKTLVSYTNPVYWGNAFFRNDFEKVSASYATLNTNLEKSMKECGSFSGKQFGSEKGLSVADIRKYHYMMGMPYFDDTVELQDFDSYQSALAKVESSITSGVQHLKLVYKVAIPDRNLTLYGFALSGPEGESKFLPVIDINNPKHTAFLPYEVLVADDKVLMLHGRYRIAVSFPDLTMGTFSKIMSTPGAIEDQLKQLVK
ncbi:MAG: hypothetical protein WAO52_05075 [Prolixibacteraceae bacterium]